MKWFGEPWPSAELRAAVCEDDAMRIPTPVGEECTLCTNEIMQDDRGVSLGHLSLDETDPTRTRIDRRYAHVDCLVRSVGGESIAGVDQRPRGHKA